MEATRDEVGTTLPTDQPTTESASAADVNTLSSSGELNPEHVCMEDIGTQLINIESIQQTIGTQVCHLENNDTETTLFELRSPPPKLDGLQDSPRKAFDAHTRPLIRGRHIYDMPNEILRNILEDVRGDFDIKSDKYPSDGIKAIQSLRLTCWRLCDVSSPLLLHRLHVSLTRSSLAHLDEVSRHPTISKGIRALWICAALYDSTLTRSLRGFIDRVFEILREEHRSDFNHLHSYLGNFCLGSRYEPFNLPTPRDHDYLSKTFDNIGKRHEILLSCADYLRAGTYQPDDDQILATLSQVHRQYSQLSDDQNALLQNDTFTTSVAGAVARLPQITGLFITDDKGFEMCPLWTEISSPIYRTVRNRLLQPSLWCDLGVSLLAQRPFELLYRLLLAVFRAGNSLTELRIRVSSDMDHETKLSHEQVRGLVSAAGHLQVLETDCHLTVQLPVQEHSSGERASVCKLASLLLNGRNLRSVALRFAPWPETNAWRVGPSIALLPWASLKKISLQMFFVHFDELSTCLEKLTPRACILLEEMHLMSGLWVDLLDVIRAKADCHSDVIEPEGNDPADATDAFFNAFTQWNCESSPATAYIRGQITDNPLRPRPDQGNVDTEDTDEED